MTTLRSIDAVAALVSDGRNGARSIVGVVGPPGSGKTTIATEVSRLIGSHAVTLPMDGFHLPQATLVELGRRDRMGAPDTFDVTGFVDLLTRLRADTGPVLAPAFDRDIEEPVADAVAIASATRVIVVEGNYLLLDTHGWDGVAPLLDLAIYVDLDREERLRRLIARHERFGKSSERARDWALGPDEANAIVIERTRSRADHVIRLPD